MLSVFKENLGSFAVLAVLILIVGLVVFKLIRDKKRGKSSCSCGCGCGSCPMKDKCHPENEKKN
jgi:hypothetical protein